MKQADLIVGIQWAKRMHGFGDEAEAFH